MIIPSDELLCIGNAMVDVFARDKEEIALRYGITKAVQHVEIEKLSGILSALSAAHPQENPSPVTIVSGGGAANVAKIAGFLGANTGFIGAVGKDHFGQRFEKDLAAVGVRLQLHLKPSPTGIFLALRLEDGKTRIAAAPSAALELSESDIKEDDIRKAKIVVIDGFMLDRSGLVLHILRLARKHGVAAAIDVSSVSIAREHAAELADHIREYSLILFMNEAEAEAFYAELKTKRSDSELLGILKRIFNNRVTRSFKERVIKTLINSVLLRGKFLKFPIVIVKLGSQGSICYSGGVVYRNGTKPVIPFETTGAGDAFCAGFLTAWAKKRPIPECAAKGNEAAGIVLHADGTKITNK